MVALSYFLAALTLFSRIYTVCRSPPRGGVSCGIVGFPQKMLELIIIIVLVLIHFEYTYVEAVICIRIH